MPTGYKDGIKMIPPIRKGSSMSERAKIRISESLKRQWKEGKRKSGMTGKQHSAETRIRMSLRHKADNNPNWKGGISKKDGYSSFHWRKREFIKNGNGGSHTIGEWETLKIQYNWTCPCCHKREPEVKLVQDHIIPVSKGGSDNIENIQPLCMLCNQIKFTKTIKYEEI